ncbi:DUF4142 domain-containing protein [Niabella sp. CC-SYL272]|uniref:DUF4142 domain-containing protein n=1 Tax=Niabella agricola TaxID=2891571 RepID=UPI001F1FD0F1|nr:DUF4142 domain-containing protein [Niabella agricola]MCF3107603.1 DUF4142 domain-containing protein [Niabella agricola]
MKKQWYAAVAVPLIILTGSCSRDESGDVNPNPVDSNYVITTSYINLGEVDAGNLAIGKSNNPVLRDYGQQLVNDHTQAQAELAETTRNMGYRLPAETDQKHKEMAAMLAQLDGRTFDSTFIYKMLEGHQEALVIQENEISGGRSPALRNYASRILPVIKKHEALADSIAHHLFPMKE